MNVEIVLHNDLSKLLLFSQRLMPSMNELLVPSKELATVLGASVEWNQAAKQMTLEHEDNIIQMTIGSNEIIVNGNVVDMPNPAVIMNNTTLIPLSMTALKLGYKVEQMNIAEFSTRFKIE